MIIQLLMGMTGMTTSPLDQRPQPPDQGPRADRRTADRRAAARQPGTAPVAAGTAPGVRLVTTVLAAATVLGAVTGTGLGLRRPDPQPLLVTVADVPGAGAPGSTAATGTAPATEADGNRSSQNPSPSPSTGAGRPAPDPAVALPQPWARGLDFAVVKGIRTDAGGVITLTVDRLTFFTGTQAAAYYKAHPDQPQADVAIVNQSPRLFSYPLVPHAPLFGATVLAGSVAPTTVTTADLLVRTRAALAAHRPLYVWLDHAGRSGDHDNAWTTFLQEQYLP